MPQCASFQTFMGVIFWNSGASGKMLCVRLMGIMMLHPMTVMMANRLRHILVNRRKMVASIPITPIISCSVAAHSGLTQASMPFPSGGGACFSSACLSLGAYTTVLYGRTIEKMIAVTAVMPSEEPRAAKMEFCWSWEPSR